MLQKDWASRGFELGIRGQNECGVRAAARRTDHARCGFAVGPLVA
jgi:hypothetical protein